MTLRDLQSKLGGEIYFSLDEKRDFLDLDDIDDDIILLPEGEKIIARINDFEMRYDSLELFQADRAAKWPLMKAKL